MKSIRTPLYNQIMEYLLRLISIQQLEGNYDFPSEMSIALQFGEAGRLPDVLSQN